MAGCTEFDHLGPVVIVWSEPIDDGIGIRVRCEECDREGDAAIDVDEVVWR